MTTTKMKSNIKNGEEKVPEIACNVENLVLQLLHYLAPYITAISDHDYENAGLIHCGVVDAACCLLSTNQDTTNANLWLELFLYAITEVDNMSESIYKTHSSLFVKTVMNHENFLRRLCALMLHSVENGNTGVKPEIEPIYGLPLSL